jgi:GNAT superfamily N-acetyltransferase
MSETIIREIKENENNDASNFCQGAIKKIYNIDYNSNWHKDLDSMKTSKNIYSTEEGGMFLLTEQNGEWIATGGITSINQKPHFKTRFNLDDNTAIIRRIYVLPEHQSKGLGTKIYHKLEKGAKKLGYTKFYLDTSLQCPKSVPYWKKMGFRIVDREPFDNPAYPGDQVVHMLKDL